MLPVFMDMTEKRKSGTRRGRVQPASLAQKNLAQKYNLLKLQAKTKSIIYARC